MSSDETTPAAPPAPPPPPPSVAVISHQELAELGGLRSRWSARRRLAARKGPQAGKLYAQLQREPPIAQLAAGVPLMLVEERGAWARVAGSNGWLGWVDGRLLTKVG